MKEMRAGGTWALAFAVLVGALLTGVWGAGVQDAWAGSEPQWAWMKGASTTFPAGTYGTVLTPAAANNPGGRQQAATWINASGALWLFGGIGLDKYGSEGYLNDLWKYEPASGNWTWMKGSYTHDLLGLYGTPLTPDAANTPGGREGVVSWTDASGCLWMFGGRGIDSAGNTGDLNDLWRYDPSSNNWTWMKGSSTCDQHGTYGTILTPAAANTPGGRDGAASWVDASGALWLFGGDGWDSGLSRGTLNDLWKYNPSSGNWTWMKGATSVDQKGTYGTILTPAVANTPGGRGAAASWIDNSGALWLFGGGGLDSEGVYSELNDLWKYSPSTGNWTWMKGADIVIQQGTYGTLGTPAPANTPGNRYSAVSWTDASGALWLFGGYTWVTDILDGPLNDLWKYDPATGNWTWMKGANSIDQAGTYGTILTPAAANTPGARSEAAAWANTSTGTLWLWGGAGYDAAGSEGFLNDLWRVILPDTTAPTGTVVINSNRSVTNTVDVTLSLSWADKGGSGASRMKFSNDAVTWTSWEPLAATKAWTLATGEGYHTVRAMFRDVAGNNSIIYSDYIRLDTVPPTGSIIINGGASSTKSTAVSLGLTWSDGTGSGVVKMRFSDDGSHWSAWEPPVTPKSHTLPSSTPGYYTVRAQFLDAGNNYSPTYSDYIKLVAP